MLTQQEQDFVDYWDKNREMESSFSYKMKKGLPFAFLFSFPILLFLIVVYFFFPTWYSKIAGEAAGSMVIIIIALIVLVFFVAFFRQHFKWEMNEQAYQEFLGKQNRV